MNYIFLLQYFATFAEEGVPKLTVFKAGVQLALDNMVDITHPC